MKHTNTTLLCSGLILGLLSIGCLLPDAFVDPDSVDGRDGRDGRDVGDGKEQGEPDIDYVNNGDGQFEDNNGDGVVDPPDPRDDPKYDPEEHAQRDDPRSSEYRGRFEVNIDLKAEEIRLNGLRLGEATYTHFDYDGLSFSPHCLVSMVDMRPDSEGRTGYIVLKFPGINCSLLPGDYEVFDEVEGVEERPDAVIVKAIHVEQENGRGFSSKTLQDTSNTVTIEYTDDRTIKGDLNISAKSFLSEDDERVSIDGIVKGRFEAIFLPQ